MAPARLGPMIENNPPVMTIRTMLPFQALFALKENSPRRAPISPYSLMFLAISEPH